MNMVIMGISPHLAMAFKALGGFAPMGTRTIKITVQRQKKNDGSKNPKAANVDPKAATEAPEFTNEVTKASVVNEKASVFSKLQLFCLVPLPTKCSTQHFDKLNKNSCNLNLEVWVTDC